MQDVKPEKAALTAKDVAKNEIVHDVLEDGIRFIIMRGPSSFCAYVGVAQDHPLSGLDYDDLSFVNAHGGLTFSGSGENNPYRPKGYYWYGWDYAHAGDHCTYFKDIGKQLEGHDWTVDEIVKDSWETLYDFKKVVVLAERLRR